MDSWFDCLMAAYYSCPYVKMCVCEREKEFEREREAERRGWWEDLVPELCQECRGLIFKLKGNKTSLDQAKHYLNQGMGVSSIWG